MLGKKLFYGLIMLVIALSSITMPFCLVHTAAAYEVNEDVPLDYDFINYVIANLSGLINVTTNNIHMGRYFGGNGDRLAAQYIAQWMNESTQNLRNRGNDLVKVYNYPIGDNNYVGTPDWEQTVIRKSNDKMDIFSYNLNFTDGTNSAIIPNNESYPVPLARPWLGFPGTISSHGSKQVVIFDADDFWRPHHKIPYTGLLLGNNEYSTSPSFIVKKIVYIPDYEQASENDTVDTIQYVEFNTGQSEDAYQGKIQNVIDSGGSGFIVATTNPSYIKTLHLSTFGLAVTPYEGQKIKDYILSGHEVYAIFNTSDTQQEGTFDICTYSEPVGDKKIGLIEERGDGEVFGRSLVEVLFCVSNLPWYREYAGFILYNKTLDKTHMLMTPTALLTANPLYSSYSNYGARPFIFINGSVKNNEGQLVHIWEWANNPNLKASFNITEQRNDSALTYNTICEIKGEDTHHSIMISGGHHDFFSGQGTSDNAIGTATMLGILKWVNESNITPNCNLTFVSFSGEEVVDRGSSCMTLDDAFDVMNAQMDYLLNLDWFAYREKESKLEVTVSEQPFADDISHTVNRTHYNETFAQNPDQLYTVRVFQHNVSDDALPFSQKYHLGVDPYGTGNITDLKLIGVTKDKKENNERVLMEARHRSGDNHTLGDAMWIVDPDDLAVTTDIVLNISKYLILDPPSNEFRDCTFTPFDICGDGQNDSVNITCDVSSSRTSWVTIKADIRDSGTGVSVANNSTWFTTYKDNHNIGYVSVTLPPDKSRDVYNITFQVMDDHGNVDDEEYELIDLHPYSKPIADFSYEIGGIGSHHVYFRDESLPSPGATITDWYWDFGDGWHRTEQNPDHIYVHPDSYDVTLTVIDSNKLEDSVTKTIKISNSLPSPAFSVNSGMVQTGQAVGFTSTSTDDGTITNYTWDFGDGSFGYERTYIEHTYEHGGLYSVSLTVRDDFEASNSTTKQECLIVADALVDDSYPSSIPAEHKWKTLQGGINDDAVKDGLLYVFNGNYAHSLVNKSMIIYGESKEGVKIQTNLLNTGLAIESDNVILRKLNLTHCTKGIVIYDQDNITIQQCQVYHNSIAGIFTDSATNCSIINCTIEDNGVGVSLNSGSNNNVVRQSSFINAQYGVYVASSSNNFIGSPLIYNYYPTDLSFQYCDYGIYLDGSTNNSIVSCDINGIPYQDSQTIGIYLDGSENNTISTCYIYETTDKGICIASSPHNKIEHCRIMENPRGIELSGSASKHNLICQNNISKNTEYSVYIPSESKMNIIIYNDFIGNGDGKYSQAYDANDHRGEENQWSKTHDLLTKTGEGEGNYWSDYTGTDFNQDGIGDTPYIIVSGRVEREDSYPLMLPYGWCDDWEN